MNRLLLRLLRKYMGIQSDSDIPSELKPFIMSCNVALEDLIIQRARAQHSLALVSDELLEKNEEIASNRDQIEQLLFNILPNSIVARVLKEEHVIADTIENTDILFADISQFTTLSAEMGGAKTVTFLNDVFTQFDTIIHTSHLKKVKTIGDCYMATTRLEAKEKKVHVDELVRASEQMIHAFSDICRTFNIVSQLRVGMNTGPVIAGVIGQSVYSYDLWGNTVNIASRLEKMGWGNAIHISEQSYRECSLMMQHRFKSQGPIAIKGKGQMQTYLHTVEVAL